MHVKPAGCCKSGNMSHSMEETIRRWLEDKLEKLELVERDLKKHVRTFVGIFRLSRQDLVQDIREEPQYPLEVRRFMDGQSSLEDLRKYVFVFELMKLTCLEKERAERIVDQLFAECNLTAGYSEEEEKEKGNPSQKQTAYQPATRSEPVSRSEQEISYTSAFPALPPKGKAKQPPEPMPNFWQQRSPLRSNPSVELSKNKGGCQDSSVEKAPGLSSKKVRTGGKENDKDSGWICPKKKVYRKYHLSKRESSSLRSTKSSEYDQYLEYASSALKQCLGLDDDDDKATKQAPAVSCKKKDVGSQTSRVSEARDREWLNLNLLQKPEQSVWDPDHVTKYPWWDSLRNLWQEGQRRLKEENWHTSQSHRSVSEPHLAKQEPQVVSRPQDQRIWNPSENVNSSPLPEQAVFSPLVDDPCLVVPESSDKNIPESVIVSDVVRCPSFDPDPCGFHPVHSSTVSSDFSSLLFSTSDPYFAIWSKNYSSQMKWPCLETDISTIESMYGVETDIPADEKFDDIRSMLSTLESLLVKESADFHQGQKQSEEESSGCVSDTDEQSDMASEHFEVEQSCQFPADNENQQLEEEMTVSFDGDSLKQQSKEDLYFPFTGCLHKGTHRDFKHLPEESYPNFQCPSASHISTGQEELKSDTASDVQNQTNQQNLMTAYTIEDHSTETSSDAALPSVVKQVINQVFPCHIMVDQLKEMSESQCSHSLGHSHHCDQEFLYSCGANLHNHLFSNNFSCFPTSDMQRTVQQYSLFDNTSDQQGGKIPSDSSFHYSSLSHLDQKPLPLFSFEPQSSEFPEGVSHPKTEPPLESFSQAQPFQSAYSVEDIQCKTFSGDYSFSTPCPNPMVGNYPVKKQDHTDQFGIISFASSLLQSHQTSPERNLVEPLSSFLINNPTSTHDHPGDSSFVLSTSQDFCRCEGACNCLSMLPVNLRCDGREDDASHALDPCNLQAFARGGRVHVAFDAFDPYNCQALTRGGRGHVASDALDFNKHQGGWREGSDYVTKNASVSNLDCVPSHKSAFKKVGWTSYPKLVHPSLPRTVSDYLKSCLSPRISQTCMVEDASEEQLEKIKKNSMKIIKPEELVESCTPDLSILDHPDIFGKWTLKIEKVPSYLMKESKGTQTSECNDDVGSSLSPTPSARQPPKVEYEEKNWKNLMPLSAEDMQRDFLYAAIQAQKQGIPQPLLDTSELEWCDYEFADFQLLSETSASLHVPQNQAVYVKDLEKAWLSESYGRLGKTKVRRPLHPKKPCSFYLEGCCYRFDCKFSHDINTITCHFWELGQCFKGELCPFLHGYFRGLGGSDGGDEFDVTKEDFPELTRKDVRLNSAPAAKKRRNKKNSVHRLQLPRGT